MSDPRKIFDTSGSPLDAEFFVDHPSDRPPIGNPSRFEVVLLSRHRQTRKDYNPGLELVLDRLGLLGGDIERILVDTRYTRRVGLSEAERTIDVRDRSYPISLSRELDSRALRLAITANIGRAGLEPGRQGGHTPLKQIRIRFQASHPIALGVVSDFLSHGPDAASEKRAVDLPDVPAGRAAVTVKRIIRDTVLVRRLKRIHDDRCQLCRLRLEVGPDNAYSEGHHLKPLGSPHNGPDTEGNIVILCPNCHALLDLGATTINYAELGRHRNHVVAEEYVRYHNREVVDGTGAG